ncbi:hypothetical protein PIB30_032836 [Stylosanthes scabra]|uniref:Uncharacterized protein n=1 Tax=Stylosanthes scabra TaxID=79078 RepID=A0ABU6ZB19_9FABA|nr:hypothetical protein [Stylosanthes scabra]
MHGVGDVAGHVQALVACPPSFHAPPSSLFSSINWEAMEGASEFPEIRSDAGWNPDTEFRIGLKWQTKEQLNRALRDYSIRRHQTFKVVQSDPQRPRYVRIGLEVAKKCKRSNNETMRKGAIFIGLEQTWTLWKGKFNTYNSRVEHFDWF